MKQILFRIGTRIWIQEKLNWVSMANRNVSVVSQYIDWLDWTAGLWTPDSMVIGVCHRGWHKCVCLHFSRLHSVWLQNGRSWLDPRQRQRIFSQASVFRAALSSTHPIQWVPVILTPRVKRGRGVTLTTLPHLVPRSRMSRSYISLSLVACMAVAV
jgi:hypothetical protein